MLINWSRFLPRLALLFIFFIALWWGQNALIAWQIRSHIARRTGAAADLAAVRMVWENDSIVLSHFQLFDPQKPDKKLFQAEKVTAVASRDDYLRRFFHFPEITVEGIQVEIAGAENNQFLPANLLGNIEKSIPKELEAVGELDWTVLLTDEPEDAARNLLQQLETLPLVADLQQRWPVEIRQFEEAADLIRRRLKNVNTLSNRSQQADDKVLLLQGILKELEGADLEIQQLVSSVAQLKQKARQDSQAITDTLKRDREKMRTLRPPEIDADQISETLVGPEIRERWEQTLVWGDWAKSLLVPTSDNESSSSLPVGTPWMGTPKPRFRGLTIPLTVFDVRPELLIDRANLAGKILYAGLPLFFNAAVSDIAYPAPMGPAPMVVQMAFSGIGAPLSPAMPPTLDNPASDAAAAQLNAALDPDVFPSIYVTMNIDRIGENREDMLIVRCPLYQLPQRILGNQDTFAISVSPGNSSLDGVVIVNDEKLRGEVRLAQTGIRLAAVLPPYLRQSDLQKALDPIFAAIDRFEASLVVSGTRDRPIYAVKSNIGEHLKPKVESIVLNEWGKLRQSLDKNVTDDANRALAILDTAVREHLDPVVQDVNAARTDWERQLARLSDVPLDQLVETQISKLSDKDRRRLENFMQTPAIQDLLQQQQNGRQGPPQLEDAIQRGVEKIEDKIPGLLERLKKL